MRRTVAVVLGFTLILAIIWLNAYYNQPVDLLILPDFEVSQALEIPPRPGIQGIEISGPVIKPVDFSIDTSKPGLRSIDWNQLQAIDAGTDIKISIYIDARGHLTIQQFDDGGHTQAGRYIREAIKTWIYKPYLSGNARIWFNLPSTGAKVLMDFSQLIKSAMVPAHVPLFFGRVHLIENTEIGAIVMDSNF